MTEKKELPALPPRKSLTCKNSPSQLERIAPGRPPHYYEAFPRDCKFAYMTPGYYATGFRILDVYKSDVDLTELKNLLFLEDPKQVEKWGLLKSRIPFPEGRVTDLPGTRELNYYNYYLRPLTPESAMSWRRSIYKPTSYTGDELEFHEEPVEGCGCEKCLLKLKH